jgi:hypothetical protein
VFFNSILEIERHAAAGGSDIVISRLSLKNPDRPKKSAGRGGGEGEREQV